jgi:WD40 repeat protein
MGDPLEHSSYVVYSAEFSPDGKRIVTTSEDKTARVWDIAPSSENYPDWMLQLAEALSGQLLNRQGMIEPTTVEPAEVMEVVRAKLWKLPQDEDWVVWGRWLLADHSKRTISPFSKTAVPEPH